MKAEVHETIYSGYMYPQANKRLNVTNIPNSKKNLKSAKKSRIHNKTKLYRGDEPDVERKSPIASVVIPDIQPVLDILTEGAKDMYNKINKLLGQTLVDVEKLINDTFTDEIPQIKTIIMAGNSQLVKDITNALDTASNAISADFAMITPKENEDAALNIQTMNDKILSDIIKIINDTEKSIADTVNDGMNESIKEVVDALMLANNALYTQIQSILADPSNTKPILPQLVYADPVAITDLLTNTNTGIYDTIVKLIQKSLVDIQTSINSNAALGTIAQTSTLKNANKNILKSLNFNVDEALKTIKKAIEAINKDEVTQITDILTKLSPTLTTGIEKLLNGLETDITQIIKEVTTLQIEQTIALIKSNNNGVLSSVTTILSTV
ncbi:hypothetical protein COBT_000190 [Conglomerata obtusa]